MKSIYIWTLIVMAISMLGMGALAQQEQVGSIAINGTTAAVMWDGANVSLKINTVNFITGYHVLNCTLTDNNGSYVSMSNSPFAHSGTVQPGETKIELIGSMPGARNLSVSLEMDGWGANYDFALPRKP